MLTGESMMSNPLRKEIHVAIVLLVLFLGVANASVRDQEVGISIDVNPKEIIVVGDYYYESSLPNDTFPCEKCDGQDGISLIYKITLYADLSEPPEYAIEDAYEIYITQKLPYEARLAKIYYWKAYNGETPQQLVSIPAYAGKEKPPYYSKTGDLLKIYFDHISAQDFPKYLEIHVFVPCKVAPATLYSSVLLRSLNDIERSNNYDISTIYIGIAYDRRFGLESFENLLKEE